MNTIINQPDRVHTIKEIYGPNDQVISIDNFKESLELNKFLAQKLILDQDPQNIEKVMNCSNQKKMIKVQTLNEQNIIQHLNDGLKFGFINFQQQKFHQSPENQNDLERSEQNSYSTKNSSNTVQSIGSIHYIMQPSSNILKMQLICNQDENVIPLKDCSRDDSSFSQIMKNRWMNIIKYLPQVDKDDIINEYPLINGNVILPFRHQLYPEYTQTCYLRIRQIEEMFPTFDYMDPLQNIRFYEFLNKNNENKEFSQKKLQKLHKYKNIVSQLDRSYGIQKIFDLHIKKNYKIETLFMAGTIFDRYMMDIGHWNFPRENILKLSLTSLLLAAKLQEMIQPCFQKLINLLSDEEKNGVSREMLIELEYDILIRQGFDFNYQCPISSMERFLRILDFDRNQIIYDMSYQICKYQMNSSKFLKYRPSQLAACAVIISINIYRRDFEQINCQGIFSDDEEQKKQSLFQYSHRKCSKTGIQLFKLNVDFWNKKYIVKISGYTIDMLIECLKELSNYIRENLQPDRLEGFDLEF